MRMQRRLVLSGIALGALAFAPATALAVPTCAQLATDPANGLAGNPIISTPTATLVLAAGSNAAYCRIDFVVSQHGGPEFGYAVGQQQHITLRVGLPLNSADGGTGGVQGAWNGKILESRWRRLRWLGWCSDGRDQYSLCRFFH